MTSRARFLVLAAGVPALALPVPATAQAPRPAIRVGTTASDAYAEAIYALDAGFFDAAGLDVNVANLANGTAIVTGIVTGALDVGIANTITLANAHNHGLPLVMIAGGALYSSGSPTTALCCARDSTLREAKDLEGKIVGVSTLGDMNALGAKAWIAANGADVAKVGFIELGFAEMAPAIKRGTVAAATMNEPQITAWKSDVRVFAPIFDVIAKRFMNGVWISTPAWTQQNPALARRFVEAIYAAGRWANAHHPESAAILAKYSKVDLETTRTMGRVEYSDGLDPRLVQLSIDLAYKYKFIDRPVSAAALVAKM